MRLTPSEHTTITSILRSVDPQGDVLLFGSRVDDRRKGGDIDLLWFTSRPLDLRTQLSAQWQLEVACDTHVDLLVKSPDEPEQPIHRIALERGVRL